jgi:hypothetical protein
MSDIYCIPPDQEDGRLDFILYHFEESKFPRTISTRTTEGKQIVVYNKEQALARFNQANFLDCKINAYPTYTEWNGINRQAPNFIFIDLDLGCFKSMDALVRVLNIALKNIDEKLDSAFPSVLWSGNGYHIYLPIKAFILELESVFAEFEQPSRKFLRFAERYLSNSKADPSHGTSLSFKNCMIRIPGSHNSKLVQQNGGIADCDTEVKIIQKWDDSRPAINYLLREFRRYLIQEKIDTSEYTKKIMRGPKYTYYGNNQKNINRNIDWIEILLRNPTRDFRKFVLWRILAPYSMNVRKLSYDHAFVIIRDWLAECNAIRKLDFDPDQRIKHDLRSAIRIGYLPIRFSVLKVENIELYGLISNVVRKPHLTEHGY